MTECSMAFLFLFLVRHHLEKKSIIPNGPISHMHLIPEGAFLLSPVIFKFIGGEEHWQKIQSGLPKLGVLYIDATGTLFHQALLSIPKKQGEATKRALHGFISRRDYLADILGPHIVDMETHPRLSLLN